MNKDTSVCGVLVSKQTQFDKYGVLNLYLCFSFFTPLLHPCRRVRPLRAAVVSQEKASSLMRQNMLWPTRERSCRRLHLDCRTLMMRTELLM